MYSDHVLAEDAQMTADTSLYEDIRSQVEVEASGNREYQADMQSRDSAQRNNDRMGSIPNSELLADDVGLFAGTKQSEQTSGNHGLSDHSMLDSWSNPEPHQQDGEIPGLRAVSLVPVTGALLSGPFVAAGDAVAAGIPSGSDDVEDIENAAAQDDIRESGASPGALGTDSEHTVGQGSPMVSSVGTLPDSSLRIPFPLSFLSVASAAIIANEDGDEDMDVQASVEHLMLGSRAGSAGEMITLAPVKAAEPSHERQISPEHAAEQESRMVPLGSSLPEQPVPAPLPQSFLSVSFATVMEEASDDMDAEGFVEHPPMGSPVGSAGDIITAAPVAVVQPSQERQIDTMHTAEQGIPVVSSAGNLPASLLRTPLPLSFLDVPSAAIIASGDEEEDMDVKPYVEHSSLGSPAAGDMITPAPVVVVEPSQEVQRNIVHAVEQGMPMVSPAHNLPGMLSYVTLDGFLNVPPTAIIADEDEKEDMDVQSYVGHSPLGSPAAGDMATPAPMQVVEHAEEGHPSPKHGVEPGTLVVSSAENLLAPSLRTPLPLSFLDVPSTATVANADEEEDMDVQYYVGHSSLGSPAEDMTTPAPMRVVECVFQQGSPMVSPGGMLPDDFTGCPPPQSFMSIQFATIVEEDNNDMDAQDFAQHRPLDLPVASAGDTITFAPIPEPSHEGQMDLGHAAEQPTAMVLPAGTLPNYPLHARPLPSFFNAPFSTIVEEDDDDMDVQLLVQQSPPVRSSGVTELTSAIPMPMPFLEPLHGKSLIEAANAGSEPAVERASPAAVSNPSDRFVQAPLPPSFLSAPFATVIEEDNDDMDAQTSEEYCSLHSSVGCPVDTMRSATVLPQEEHMEPDLVAKQGTPTVLPVAKIPNHPLHAHPPPPFYNAPFSTIIEGDTDNINAQLPVQHPPAVLPVSSSRYTGLNPAIPLPVSFLEPPRAEILIEAANAGPNPAAKRASPATANNPSAPLPPTFLSVPFATVIEEVADDMGARLLVQQPLPVLPVRSSRGSGFDTSIPLPASFLEPPHTDILTEAVSVVSEPSAERALPVSAGSPSVPLPPSFINVTSAIPFRSADDEEVSVYNEVPRHLVSHNVRPQTTNDYPTPAASRTAPYPHIAPSSLSSCSVSPAILSTRHPVASEQHGDRPTPTVSAGGPVPPPERYMFFRLDRGTLQQWLSRGYNDVITFVPKEPITRRGHEASHTASPYASPANPPESVPGPSRSTHVPPRRRRDSDGTFMQGPDLHSMSLPGQVDRPPHVPPPPSFIVVERPLHDEDSQPGDPLNDADDPASDSSAVVNHTDYTEYYRKYPGRKPRRSAASQPRSGPKSAKNRLLEGIHLYIRSLKLTRAHKRDVKRWNRGDPSGRKPSMDTIGIDFSGSIGTRWNMDVRALIVRGFKSSEYAGYIPAGTLPGELYSRISTYFKYVKDHHPKNPHPRTRDQPALNAKARKASLLDRRICGYRWHIQDPSAKRALSWIRKMGTGGTSDDEEDPVTSTTEILTPMWRNPDARITRLFHYADYLYAMHRFRGGTLEHCMRGALPARRVDTGRTNDAPAPLGLPRNFYRKSYLARLDTLALDRLQVAPAIDLNTLNFSPYVQESIQAALASTEITDIVPARQTNMG
ncbi:hypothetical protein CYLTODRAFT_458785 [Cylindrobasidium torrendii FP15055 ss-10]|uniref:Uncharacterized protein n=1 Tax=Cylindrobasidium torrendii FP15055 ss-10 TaxID=1314674 RepID=A0A0D7AWS7_9AGAR|nr:hypothetical protein CYLTODRAFT_458785 [Cylindrobasidium torrendii FP15055 ss-10]